MVIDAQSKAPISGATVSLMSYGFAARPENDVSGIRTSADGRFEIPPRQEWSVYIVPMDPAPLWGQVKIKANGYVDVEKEISTSVAGPSVTNFGSIPMTRAGK